MRQKKKQKQKKNKKTTTTKKQTNKKKKKKKKKKQELPGLILSFDFVKAFDTVSWEFISKALVYYNFGPSIRKWINLFQSGAKSSAA